jgi:hypothetical protein
MTWEGTAFVLIWPIAFGLGIRNQGFTFYWRYVGLSSGILILWAIGIVPDALGGLALIFIGAFSGAQRLAWEWRSFGSPFSQWLSKRLKAVGPSRRT